MSAMLLYIITNAVLFSFILTSEQIPQSIAQWLLESGIGPLGFLLAVNILLLWMGNFIEPSSIILITAPILFPIATQLGIDPIHFGIIVTGRPQSLRCQRHRQGRPDRNDTRRWPLAAHHARLPARRHLLAGAVAVAAAHAGDDRWRKH